MPSIVTVTFSPSIDKSFTVPEMVPDKKLRCSAPQLDPGGGGINVARAIKILGGEATAVFPSGGYTGKQFDKLLEEEEVPMVIIESGNETRENIVVVDLAKNLQYRFGMPGTELLKQEWEKILQVIEDIQDIEFLVCSGSLPPGVPENIYAQLAAIAKQKGAKCIVDTAGRSLKLAMEASLYLIKPNIGELSAFAGKGFLSIEEVKEIALNIIDSRQCEVVVVSMGGDGAMLVSKDVVEIYKSPKVERKSTVGAGDSMVAGIVYSLSLKKTLEEAVRYGVACGTAATMNPGTELCRKEDADALFERL